jgi:hypothetical protein
MPEPTFDPLAEWLAIPPAEQPPHHYRLLGLALFEDDAAAIERAADERMAIVRRHQTGPRAAATQQVLNRLAAAKQCLLNSATRGAYDAAIRGQLAARQSGAAKAKQPQLVEQPPAFDVEIPPVDAAMDFGINTASASQGGTTSIGSAGGKRVGAAGRGPRPIMLASILLSLVTACAAVYVIYTRDDEDAAQTPRVIVIERPSKGAGKSSDKTGSAADGPPIVRPEGGLLRCTAEHISLSDVQRRSGDLLDLTIVEGRVEVSWTVRVRQAGFYAPSITYSAAGEGAQTFEIELNDGSRRTTPVRATAGVLATDDLKAIAFKKTGDHRVILRAGGAANRDRTIKVRELVFKPLSLPDPVKPGR